MILKIVELTQECDKEHGQGWLHSGKTLTHNPNLVQFLAMLAPEE